MLVLTRRVGQGIVIDGQVQLKVVSVQNQRVKVSISAPEHVTIHRKEIHQRIQERGDGPGRKPRQACDT